MNNNIASIQELLEAPFQERGYDLVQIKWLQGHPAVLQIMAERQNGGPLTLDDCITLNHLASTLLDVHEPISHAYHLEVSSPGIDRPLVKKQDFQRFAGQEAFIEVELLGEKPKRLTGILAGMQEDKVILKVENQDIPLELPYSNIRQAHLRLEKSLWAKAKKSLSPSKKNQPDQKRRSSTRI